MQIAKGKTPDDATALCMMAQSEIPQAVSMREMDAYGRALQEYLENKIAISQQEAAQAHAYAQRTALRETDRATYQAMEALIHNLNTMNSRAGAQVPFSSLNYGTDTSPEGRMAMRNLLLATEAGLGEGKPRFSRSRSSRSRKGSATTRAIPITTCSSFPCVCRRNGCSRISVLSTRHSTYSIINPAARKPKSPIWDAVPG